MQRRSYTYTKRRGERGFNFAVAAVMLYFLGMFSLMVGGIIVALHFIVKYW